MDFRKGMNIEKNISVEPYFIFIFLLYFWQLCRNKEQEFWNSVFNKEGKEQTSFKLEDDKEQELIDLFVTMFKGFRSEFEKELK